MNTKIKLILLQFVFLHGIFLLLKLCPNAWFPDLSWLWVFSPMIFLLALYFTLLIYVSYLNKKKGN